MRLAVGTLICVLAKIGWTTATHGSISTPETPEMAIKAANGGKLTESKITFLFAPAVYQTFVCLLLLNPLIRWTRFVQKAIEKAGPKDLWTGSTIGRFRFPVAVDATLRDSVTLLLESFISFGAAGIARKGTQ